MTQRSLKVATFNICHAKGRDGVVDLRRTAEVIRGLGADLVALQELDVRVRRSKNVDQPAELAELLNMHVHFAPTLALDDGEYGIALASPGPFKATVEMLPRVSDEEPRAAIIASWHKLAVVTTHLSRSAEARSAQTQHLADLAQRLGDPLILLGDLNQPLKDLGPLTDKGFSAVKPAKRLLETLRPRRQIDHVLVSASIGVIDARVVPSVASDHFPLVAEITLG